MYKNIEERRAKARELYSKNPEIYSKRNKEKRENRRKQLYESLGNKCSKCESTSLLEIDHINPGLKKNRVSPLAQGISKTINELDNLQLLCYECHRERSKHQKNAAWNLFKSLPLEQQEKLIEEQSNNPTTIS
jgi:5-methylcytosine-specific restriction endonuclease McrA